ncbi:MAG TPA: ABC transporter permease [Streptosporangiaceae bacterium]|nr:ABC transporter permease [Streptosporangiaceae bacterium]
MTAYLVRRLAQAIAVVFGVTLLVFLILHALPGGPARGLLGPEASTEQVHEFIVQNGYNRPLWVQYGRFLDQLAHGNLGYSYQYNQTVASLLSQDLPKSALLVGLAYLVALVIAIPLGIQQALRRNTIVDYVSTGVSFIAYSMPVFWLGILLILGFAVSWRVLPPEGPQGATVAAVLHNPKAMILPVATLALVTIAVFSRFMRSSAIENLLQDYIRTARAMGVPERTILFRHLLRNSLIPIITLIGLSLPITISGAVLTESVFNYPGMGLLFWTSATSHDFPVLLGSTIVIATATVVGSLLADLLYAVADPRVRYS